MKPFTLTHPNIPDSVFATTEKAYEEVWKEKGWVLCEVYDGVPIIVDAQGFTANTETTHEGDEGGYTAPDDPDPDGEDGDEEEET